MGEKFEPEVFVEFCNNTRDAWGLNVKVVVFDPRDIEFAKRVCLMSGTTPFFITVGNPSLQVHRIFRGTLARNLLERYRIVSEWVMDEPILQGAIVLPQLHVLMYGNERER